MNFVARRINGFSFRVYERIFPDTNTLLVGDSLIRDFNMQEVDVISIAGGRAEDIGSYLRSCNLEKYHYVILFSGGNGLSRAVKNGRIRPPMSPNEVKEEVHATAGYLHELGIRVFVVGIPRRKNFSFFSICCLNELLCRDTYRYVYVGVASKMSCDYVLAPDGIHLNSIGVRQLKTILNRKVFGFLRNEI